MEGQSQPARYIDSYDSFDADTRLPRAQFTTYLPLLAILNAPTWLRQGALLVIIDCSDSKDLSPWCTPAERDAGAE